MLGCDVQRSLRPDRTIPLTVKSVRLQLHLRHLLVSPDNTHRVRLAIDLGAGDVRRGGTWRRPGGSPHPIGGERQV
jgi:hypothetical protein